MPWKGGMMHRGARHVAAALCCLTAVSCLAAGQPAPAHRSEALEVSCSRLSLTFDRAHGRLERLFDPRTKTEFIEPDSGDAPLWQIDFLPGAAPATLSSSSSGSFRWERTKTAEPGLRLVWDKFDEPGARQLRIQAEVTIDSGVSRWKIFVDNPGRLGIEKVRFPRVANIRHQPDERLAVPVWMGELTRDPRATIFDRPGRPARLEWPYPGTMSLQCLAFYRENGPGLFLSCDDTAAFRKAFAFWGEAGRRIGYEMIHLPENRHPPATSYSPAYSAVIGTFSGDWVTASEQYRAWGTKQQWARQSRLNRGLVPDWLHKTGLWVWNRGRSDQVLEPAEVLKRELQLPVSVFWHWWHGCPYDTGFPEYLPPREGSETFKQAVSQAHREGLRAIVYMNQRLWGMTTRSWKEKGAQRFAVKGLDGTVRPEIYNTYTGQACASMCIATPFWRDTYAGIAEEAVCDLDVDGIYMDQACSSLLCYDPSHRHPLGGGTFWMNGFRLLSSDIRRRTAPVKRVLLAGEGSGEAWLPYLDLMLTLQVSRERYAQPGDGWEVIPFFQAVYHDCGITYGNYSAMTIPPYDELWPAEYAPEEPLKLLDRRYATQFCLEQARTFAWGIQPTVSNFMPSHLRERTEEMGYLLKLARIRYLGLKYLLYGKFLRPPELKVPEVQLDISRLSIYAGRRGRVTDPSKTEELPVAHARKTSPGVIAGAWRAKDGSVGIALASILEDAVSFEVDLKPYGVPGDRGVFIRDEGGRRQLKRSASSTVVNVSLAPLGACILEVR